MPEQKPDPIAIPGLQSAFPWATGQQELQPTQNQPEHYRGPIEDRQPLRPQDEKPSPEALGLRVLSITKRRM